MKIQNQLARVVVIGTSAGGLKALMELTKQLGDDFPAPVLVVQHISADASGDVLLDALRKTSGLKCSRALNGAPMLAGHLYLAPSDHHLMVGDTDTLLVTKGAQENRWRPAIDPLFRSAAVTFGNRAIGIILTGYLDDGTAGLVAISRCGGSSIVQDPDDADYPDMPKNALNQVKADYCVPIAEMGDILKTLVNDNREKIPIPVDLLIESKIAKRVLSDLPAVKALGKQVPFNCPGCGGILWKIGSGKATRYRCHTGHAYTAKVLLAEQTMKIEETMWVALRMFEERKNLLTTMAADQHGATLRTSEERIENSQVHIDRIKSILLTDDKGTKSDMPV
ncbi:chemotaxis protein CheB [Hufsiella ginkgonis]|uniref:protein-glutamate methylesterase n=1 Tax=Hufsiella ginkgonis TaxID=2695274 RepID=A0A7K1Y0L2_9SPHI|nr:chemotaxis protein CheB [Hufsiella ginkgonis]MXV16627.1 chemotaxis protein CheB [Hufsiella ginkgonis]